MTPSEILLEAEETAHTIEIREKRTGAGGVANSVQNGIAVFYGALDGSDDAVISYDEFNERFEITAILY